MQTIKTRVISAFEHGEYSNAPSNQAPDLVDQHSLEEDGSGCFVAIRLASFSQKPLILFKGMLRVLIGYSRDCQAPRSEPGGLTILHNFDVDPWGHF